jgi:uncharacterized protein YydD (DUF2326 family)
MRLLRLTTNQTSFREVAFNETGITLIVGKGKATEKTSEHTYNGVGKSLLLYLVNFCLGSDPKPQLAEKLPKWAFSLEFKLGNSSHLVKRTTEEQEKVLFDGAELKLEKFRDWLEARVFHLPKPIPYLTFRSLIGIFLRPGKQAYDSYDRLHYSEKPYQKLVRNAFLLGIDTELIRTKYDLRLQIETIREVQQSFEKDPVLREYFVGDKDLNIALKEHNDELRKLEESHKTFKVAENYKQIEEEANEFRRQLQVARNEIYLVENSIGQIEESLRQKPDVGMTQIADLYAAAKVKFPANVVEELKALAEFHTALIQKRQARLEAELVRARGKLKSLSEQLVSFNANLNDHLKFLSGHGAFSEYVALSDKLAAKRQEVQRLRDYKRLTKEYKEKVQELKMRLIEENIKGAKYLEEHEEEIAEVTETFRLFAKRIYPDKGSALVVINNDGENQTRFDIDAKIISDTSDGINEVKLFCFDMTLLLGRKHHKVDFLCHDSRLYSDIDPRQRSELFKIAHESSAKAGFQYIATINQDHLEAMQQWLGEDYKAVITDNVVLELTDDSTAGKLLGIEVDLDYESTKNRAAESEKLDST